MNRSVRSLTIICPWATLLEVWIKTHIKRNSKIKNLFEINSLIGTIWQNRYAIRRKTFTPCKWRVMFNYIFNRLPSLQGHLYTLNLLLVHYMNAWPVFSCIHLSQRDPHDCLQSILHVLMYIDRGCYFEKVKLQSRKNFLASIYIYDFRITGKTS